MKMWDTHEYEMAHGCKPRGVGSWAFTPMDSNYRSEPPEDGIAWAWGSYGDAKKEVAKRFPRVMYWTVLS